MTEKKFQELLDYVIENHIKGKMCSKSAEYSRGDDKLHNFYRAAEIDRISPEEALRGMDLKHRTSISDMLDDLAFGIDCPKEVWLEKITDDINYKLLLLGLLYERYGWTLNGGKY